MTLSEALQTVSERRGALAVVLAGTGATLLTLKLIRSRVDPFRQVPGSWFLGVAAQLGPGGKLISQKLEEWSDEYGEEGVFEMNLAGDRVVVCCSWEQAHPVLSRRPFKMTKELRFQNVTEIIAGSFFSEGDRWKRERRTLSPAFNAKNLQSYVPAIEQVTQQLLRELGKDCSTKGEVNLSELFPLYTADVICKTALGHELQMLEKRTSDVVEDVKALFGAMQARMFAVAPYWKLPGLGRLFDGGSEASQRCYLRSEEILQSANSGGHSIADKLKAMKGDKFTHKELMDNLTVLFLAGTDTTSLVLGWACYHMARDPALQAAVAQEVQSLPDQEISFAQLEALPLVRGVWMEALRLNGPASWIGLTAAEPTTLAGRTIPAGTNIMVATKNILKKDPEVKKRLGDDLQDFRPSRWLGPEGIIKHEPFDTLPFGYGARICLGMRLAEYEGLLVIAKIIQKFILESWDKPPLIETSAFVNNEPDAPIIIRVRPRTW